jgi:hypothetical protein
MIKSLFAFAFASLVGASAALSQTIANPQPTADQLKPGLEVSYYIGMFRHIDEFASWTNNRGKPGAPIPQINWKAGQGEVLDSGASDGVGVRIAGFIHLEQPGEYKFSFLSNDGVRLIVGGVEVVDDPTVHKDQWSDIGSINIATPGWYPLKVIYFERKNTSSLSMHWRPPGAGTEGSMPLVPAAVLAHVE